MHRLATARNKAIGLKETSKAIEKGQAQTVYYAKDADEKVVSPIVSICRERGIPLVEVSSMRELGKACGIQVGAALAALL